jgi:hypothetical protein
VTIEEDEGVQRHVLCGSRYLRMDSEMGEKGAYFRGAHVLRMTLVVKQDETADPVYVRVFGPDTHVLEA